MSGDDGVIDADTRRTITAGRQTAGEMLSAAQSKLQRVFIIFVIGLLGTIYAMRVWIWPQLKTDLLARGATVVAITPFDIILLQAKLGILVGILLSIPAFLYYSREPLRRRGFYPQEHVSRWKLAAIGLLSVLLFTGGVTYSYTIFFPVMFEFLADNATSAGLSPTYSIVYWTEFIVVLALSFGLAAQLPLAMTGLSYAEIVPYETFRDKWKYAIIIFFTFGALFSPPEPFTQLMWAAPLVLLYAFSLYLSRLAVALRRGSEGMDLFGSVRANLHRLAAAAVLVGGIGWWLLTDGLRLLNRSVLPRLPAAYRPGPIDPAAVPLADVAGGFLLPAAAGLVAALLLALYYAWPRLERPAVAGDPGAIDFEPLDAAGVRAAPPEAFTALEEDEAVALAGEAIDAGDREKARAILDRYDEAAEAAEEVEGDTDAEAVEADEDGNALTRGTAGFVDAFTEEETTEDDIGGYYHDLAFIFNSIRSKGFRIFAVFIGVLSIIFGVLYSGGIGAIKADFLLRLPAVVRPEEIDVVTLHPVEALVFEIKIATLLGAVATLPLLLYYAWPALKERGVASGDRSIFFGWAGAIFGGLILGSVLGYLYVAPAVISYFVWDALQADMVIAYRVSNFFWLVFFTTVGIGLWLDIPITMLLFHRGGIVRLETFRARWRVVVLAILAIAAIFTPAGILSMILVTIPVMVGYGVGLVLVWLYSLGERVRGRAAPEPS